MCGTSIFLFACIVGTPGVLPPDHPLTPQLWIGLYWVPFGFGSLLFIASSVMFALEVQEAPLRPSPGRLAWWLAVANLGGCFFFCC